MTRAHNLSWAPTTRPPPLASGALHLWRARLDATRHLDALLHDIPLSREEIARAQRYLRPVHGSLWAQSRLALHTILAHYTHAEARPLELLIGPHGKPTLDAHHDLTFNLSHSHGWALLGVMRGSDVLLGVDIERCERSRDLHAIATRVFSPFERRRLHDAHDPDEVSRRFHAIWTQKEAYIKALGLGLTLPLQSFDVDDVTCAILDTRHDEALPATSWHMYGGAMDAHYAFAACVDRSCTEILGFELV